MILVSERVCVRYGTGCCRQAIITGMAKTQRSLWKGFPLVRGVIFGKWQFSKTRLSLSLSLSLSLTPGERERDSSNCLKVVLGDMQATETGKGRKKVESIIIRKIT